MSASIWTPEFMDGDNFAYYKQRTNSFGLLFFGIRRKFEKVVALRHRDKISWKIYYGKNEQIAWAEQSVSDEPTLFTKDKRNWLDIYWRTPAKNSYNEIMSMLAGAWIFHWDLHLSSGYQ